MRRGTRVVLVIMIIAGLCLYLPGAIIRHKIEQSVAARVSGMLGGARSYSVHVSGGLLSILGGKIGGIDIHGRDVKLSSGIVVDRIDISLRGVHFKPDQTITGIDSTGFTASLSETNLSEYVRTSQPDLKADNISLADGKLSLSAKPRVLAVRTPVRLEGSLRIVRGTKLDLALDRLVARGIRVPGFIRSRIQHDLNPVVDTTQMGMNARLTKVLVDNGAITLSGTARLK